MPMAGKKAGNDSTASPAGLQNNAEEDIFQDPSGICFKLRMTLFDGKLNLN